MKSNLIFVNLFFLIFLLIGCNNEPSENGSPEYIGKIKTWHKERIENLKKENGWLNLAGLYWLKEGENTFGTNPKNDIVFPKGTAPGTIGILTLKNGVVTAKINPHLKVVSDGSLVQTKRLRDDTSGDPTIMNLGHLRWFIIKRSGKYGVRLRNLNSKLLDEFTGIETFPIDEDWKITAKFEPYNPPKKISIPSIIGTVEEDNTPGALVFEKNGDEYKLDVIEEGDEFFIIFADETSGEETYGAGRFLYTDRPNSNGNVILDFNKAYNPPCAFTPYATCPLPPKQNYLKLKITAGEKKYGDH